MRKILPVAGAFAFFLIFLIARAETRAVSITIDNPNGPLTEASVVFYVPFEVAPVNLAANAVWDEARRELKINLGSFATKESKDVQFVLSGPAGRYLLSGKINGRWPATNGRPEEVFEEAISSFAVFLGEAQANPISDLFKSFRDIPELVQLADRVTKPISAALSAAGAAAIANSAVSASGSFAAGLSKFLSYLGLGFLRISRKKPWGRVINKLTGKPIDGVTIKIIDARFKKVKQSQITDSEGRFGFLISPGDYYLHIAARGFAAKETRVIKVFGQAQPLNIEVLLEPLQSSLALSSYRLLKVAHFFGALFQKLSSWVLAVGAILAATNLILTPNTQTYIIGGLYLALIIIKIALHEATFKSFGWILDKNSNRAISLSVVRIFDANKNWLLGTRVTDESGRFNFLIGPGDYYVTVAKDGYKSFQSATAHFTKSGLISYDIKLEKA